MRKHFSLALPLSLTTVFGMSTMILAQSCDVISFTVKGGNPSVIGKKNPSISIYEMQKGDSSDPNRQTWVVIHGFQDYAGNTELASVGNIIAKRKPNDRVIMLDWSEASKIKSLADINSPDVSAAASWITPIAKEVFNRLKDEVPSQNLNLVGHSLGSLLSSEIATLFKNDSAMKVKRIIALDPPNKLGGGQYDIDGSTEGNQYAEKFRDVATISKAFVGKNSVFGSQDLAKKADESYLVDMKIPIASGLSSFEEHQGVVNMYEKLIADGLPQVGGGKNDILGFESGNINVKKDAYNGFTGELIINKNDGYKPYRLYVADPQTGEKFVLGEPDRITKIGTYVNNTVTYTRDQTGKIINSGIDVIGKGVNAGIDATGKIIRGGSDIISSIFTPIPIYAPGYEVNQDTYQQQTQNTLMLNGINGITQGSVSPIGSPSTSFIAYNPTVDLSKPRTENIQEKNQYTDGTIVKAPLDIGLTWNQSTKLDLDSHTVTPSGDHVYFNQRGSLTNSPNTFLYRDSIPAGGKLGAEQTRITTFQEGEYRFYVYNYSDQQNLFPSGLPTSAAKVQLFQGGAPLTDIPNDPNNFDLNDQRLQKVGQPYPGTNTFNVPTGQSGNAWYVFKLNTRTGILNRVDRFGNVDSSSKIPTFK
jgi:pimeloyl-ACP methyl ester carboxylesterase